MIDNKILLLGAHGTGRTTLAKRLASACRTEFQTPEVKIIDGLALKARDSGYKLNKYRSQTVAHQSQLFMLGAYLRSVRLCQARWAILADNIGRQYVYSAYNGMWTEWLNLLKGLFLEETLGATVLYIPREFPLPWDELHHPDPEFQEEIDAMILDTLDDCDIDYFVVRGGSENPDENIELRAQNAMNIIRQKAGL